MVLLLQPSTVPATNLAGTPPAAACSQRSLACQLKQGPRLACQGFAAVGSPRAGAAVREFEQTAWEGTEERTERAQLGAWHAHEIALHKRQLLEGSVSTISGRERAGCWAGDRSPEAAWNLGQELSIYPDVHTRQQSAICSNIFTHKGRRELEREGPTEQRCVWR